MSLETPNTMLSDSRSIGTQMVGVIHRNSGVVDVNSDGSEISGESPETYLYSDRYLFPSFRQDVCQDMNFLPFSQNVL